jgi:hypothetical protein
VPLSLVASCNKGDGNWFEDDSSGVQWTGTHLIIEPAAVAGTPAIQLNLIFDPEHKTWKGHLRRSTFDHYVRLVRADPKTGITKSSFVGTWYRATLMNNCRVGMLNDTQAITYRVIDPKPGLKTNPAYVLHITEGIRKHGVTGDYFAQAWVIGRPRRQ